MSSTAILLYGVLIGRKIPVVQVMLCSYNSGCLTILRAITFLMFLMFHFGFLMF